MIKTALITGGNSGIGYATALAFKQNGYHVTISGRDRQKLAKAANDLGVEWHVIEMSQMDHFAEIAKKYVESGLDVLVNNAALAAFMPIEAHTQYEYERFFNTNIRGPFALIQALLPALQKCQGAVVNISSAITTNGLPNASLYAATKGAIEAMTRSLAIEFAPKNVRVNAVSPGAIDTPILSKLGMDAEQMEIARRHMESTIPLRRYGTPEEVAHAIFAIAKASYVTGAVWAVDGGVSAR